MTEGRSTRKRRRATAEEDPSSIAAQPEKSTKRAAKQTSGPRVLQASKSEDAAESATARREDEDEDAQQQFWLMKAEQEDREVTAKNGSIINAKFTIDDLKAKTSPEPWDGVRNVVARNNMRAMKLGDLAFFYASGGKGKNKPGITGIMEVVKEHEADWTVSDEGAYGYVEEGKRGTEWSLVHVEYRKKLAEPVTLKELQQHSGSGQPLDKMQLLSNSRVSVSRVTKKQWDFIVDGLVQGYAQ